MALTRVQKEAIAWRDVAAGLATAEFGFVSFVIAAAASMSYYKDKQASAGWDLVVPPPGPIPSDSENQGELHNLTVAHYLNDFPDGDVNYNEVLDIATQVRPDLRNQITGIPQDYYNQNVALALSADLATVESQLAFISDRVPLNADNTSSVSEVLSSIQGADTNVWIENLDELVAQIDNFELPEDQKNNFKNSLQILKFSRSLWDADGEEGEG